MELTKGLTKSSPLRTQVPALKELQMNPKDMAMQVSHAGKQGVQTLTRFAPASNGIGCALEEESSVDSKGT